MKILWYSFLLATIYPLLLACSNESRALAITANSTPACVEACEDQTFLGNYNNLRASDGFRQNVWLSCDQGSIGAICMDLNHQLYLVVDTDVPFRSEERINQRFRSLRINATTLRKRMDSDAFILNRDGIDWISRIPSDAEETFPSDLFRELCGVNLQSSDIRFGWD